MSSEMGKVLNINQWFSQLYSKAAQYKVFGPYWALLCVFGPYWALLCVFGHQEGPYCVIGEQSPTMTRCRHNGEKCCSPTGDSVDTRLGGLWWCSEHRGDTARKHDLKVKHSPAQVPKKNG